MNGSVRVEAHESRLCEETETVYEEDFYTPLTAVVNALDNVEARTFNPAPDVDIVKRGKLARPYNRMSDNGEQFLILSSEFGKSATRNCTKVRAKM